MGSIERCRELVESGYNPNVDYDGELPLHCAAEMATARQEGRQRASTALQHPRPRSISISSLPVEAPLIWFLNWKEIPTKEGGRRRQ